MSDRCEFICCEEHLARCGWENSDGAVLEMPGTILPTRRCVECGAFFCLPHLNNHNCAEQAEHRQAVSVLTEAETPANWIDTSDPIPANGVEVVVPAPSTQENPQPRTKGQP